MARKPCGSCGKETDLELCGSCGRTLIADLRAVGWLAPELEVSCAGQKAASYSPIPTRGVQTGPEVNWQAVEARAELTRTLAAVVAYLNGRGIIRRWQWPMANNLPATAGMLADDDVIDALSINQAAPDIAARVGQAVAKAKRAVDTRPARQYLGSCDCGGPIYAEVGEPLARCRDCRASTDAEQLRADLLAELDDRLVTAAEAADLSTHLGLRAPREKVRQRINQWHKRGRLEGHGGADTRFLFGEVWRALIASESNG